MAGESDAAWQRFDALVAAAGTESPWQHEVGTPARFVPDRGLLEALLTTPVQLGLTSQSGAPAKAVDVWAAHELRRAGFGPDEVWPRATSPRVLPYEIALLREHKDLPREVRQALFERIDADAVKRSVTSSDAYVLGKAYSKQVDVLIAQWSRGPELMISTKRMGSSFGNNALNRIEESYGDAKNLRGRHPLAATGYLFVIRGTAFRTDASTAARLVDLLIKLAQEADAYDATGLIVHEWIGADGARIDDTTVADPSGVTVRVDDEPVPPELRIDRFLTTMVDAVLTRTPVDLHVEVRNRRRGIPLPIEESATGALDAPPPGAHTDEPG
jgi:hypothetical protein